MKVALLEASHWHVPLYLEPLEAPGIEVVAVSDAEQVKGQAVAARFGSTLYSSSYELLDRERVDFAFAFGRHSEMPAIAEALIARKISFALEKPCGVSMSQVTRLRKLTEGANLYCAIPFIFRSSDLLAALKDAEGRIPSDFNYMSFRFIVGAPDRYEAAGAGWALDPVFSGGGSTINVATHFIDFFRLLTGKEIARVSATRPTLPPDKGVRHRLLCRFPRDPTCRIGRRPRQVARRHQSRSSWTGCERNVEIGDVGSL